MFDVKDTLLPPTATPLAKALDILEERLFDLPVRMISKDPALVDVGFLTHLAWENSVDVWEENWPEDIRRAIVASSDEVHRFKGTPFAIRRALEAYGMSVSLTEWFAAEAAGLGLEPGSFLVTAYADGRLYGNDPRAPEKTLRALVQAVKRVAPVSRRAHFRLGVHFGALSGFRTGARARLRSRANQAARPAVQTARVQIAPLGRVVPFLASRRNASVRASGIAVNASSVPSVVANHRLRSRTNGEHHLRLPVITGASSSSAQLHSTIRLTTKSQITHTVTERSA